MEDSDAPARQAAVDRGNTVITLSDEEAAQWAEVAQPIYDEWVAEMNAKGIDGQALVDEARGLIDTYSK
jgi:TRAP-type C4-dicarboxylate transport system substrate-binding protein